MRFGIFMILVLYFDRFYWMKTSLVFLVLHFVSAVTTVQENEKATVATNRIRQVNAEVGTLITLGLVVNAAGNSIPPFIIFPWKSCMVIISSYFIIFAFLWYLHFWILQDYFVIGGPIDCVGEANGSGRMLGADFLLFMQHFVKNVKPSIDRPVLVTLDNHNFHLDIRVLDYCRDNHVILFPFPPHCSHKLQPLELGIFASLKR